MSKPCTYPGNSWFSQPFRAAVTAALCSIYLCARVYKSKAGSFPVTDKTKDMSDGMQSGSPAVLGYTYIEGTVSVVSLFFLNQNARKVSDLKNKKKT